MRWAIMNVVRPAVSFFYYCNEIHFCSRVRVRLRREEGQGNRQQQYEAETGHVPFERSDDPPRAAQHTAQHTE
jgi:hypothetical protein